MMQEFNEENEKGRNVKRFLIIFAYTLFLGIICLSIGCAIYCDVTGRCITHKWIDANCGYPKTCSECSLTKGEVTGEEHQWKDADCENPKTCSVCDMTEGESLRHEWLGWTCTEGSKCGRCGLQPSYYKPKGHTGTDWTVDTPATCSQVGLKHSTCSDCGESIEESIPKEAHNLMDNTYLSSTSTFKAVKSEWCLDCDYSIENTYEVSGDERKRLYKKACYSPSYEAIARNPSAYNGDLGVYTGRVIQVSGSTLRVNVPSGYGVETMLITSASGYDNGSRILEDDIITIYGEITGVTSYETVRGDTLTIPSMDAEYIERTYY